MTPPAAHVPRFFVRQHITLMVNRYEILAANPDGTAGPLLAFAQQKRVALREEVTFYADRQQTRRLFSFKARKVVDLGSGYDVLDDAGRPVGFFRKDFRASLTRSTWHVSAHGLEAAGRERSAGVALLRRVWDLIPYLGEVWVPFVFHFDFVDAVTGRPVMTSERQLAIRDRYTVTVPDPRLDLRVAASMAVALDALQGR
ncbi:hypothetical protein [Georgenia thermotolerans]|uniref:Uncharacterized protein n=1 Tax=Georgenia thermotolerans TaxID=527326 RepID=A0A7J5URX8_9MICO|nr:hypothetical protein [Georgenia thermotolerans]KAE8765196.1 hypothetical protein GB883_05090 [Georgenia thermotolerans]